MPAESESNEFKSATLRLEGQRYKLEVVKTLHAAALERWKDRRDNEWKLNYAIWTAIAAVDGALFFRKQPFAIPSGWIVTGIVLAIVFHATYLWPAIKRAISEIEMQKDAELALLKLLDSEGMSKVFRVEHIGGAIDRYDDKGRFWSGLWKHYGFYAPIGLTAALLVFGGLLARRQDSVYPEKANSGFIRTAQTGGFTASGRTSSSVPRKQQ